MVSLMAPPAVTHTLIPFSIILGTLNERHTNADVPHFVTLIIIHLDENVSI